MAIRINKIDKGDIVKIFEDSPNATSYYALWYKEFPVLEIDEKKKVAIIEHCGEHCMISFDDLKFVKEQDVEMAKRGMMVADSKKKIEDMSLKEADDYMGIWHNEKATFMFPKDMIYIWFYDSKEGIQKLFKKNEYDPMLFPPGYWGQRTPPLMQVWTKGYAKKVKGAEHVIGVIQGHLEDGNLYIDMMTVRPTYRRNKINSLMVRNLKEEFKPKKVIFVNTTKMGKSFEGSGKYGTGGNIEVGDKVKATKAYGSKSGVVVDKRGSFVIVKDNKGETESYHESDLIKRMKMGGGVDEKGIDLFEDYENIPKQVQDILDKYSKKFGDDLGNMDYKDMAEMHDEVYAVGYTFESGLDNQPYDLRPIGTKGKSELEEYKDGGEVGVYDIPKNVLRAYDRWNDPKIMPNFLGSEKEILNGFAYKLKADGKIKNITSGGHAYVEALRWLDENKSIMKTGGDVGKQMDYSKTDTSVLKDMGIKLLKDGSKESMKMAYDIMQELQKRK